MPPNEAAGSIIVEFFGIPRQRAGRGELQVLAATGAELLAAIEKACPGLIGLRRPNGCLAPQYLLSVDGRRFLGDLNEPLKSGERVLLLSADVGG